ncbi:MAG: GGDEF domain-containing protein [Patulibacter sp.]
MKGGRFFDLGNAERRRILDVAGRLGSVRWPATAIVVAAIAAIATASGPSIIPPVALYLCLLPPLTRLAHATDAPERVLVGALVLAQLTIVAALALATAWGIEGLGFLVLPVVVASMLLPPRALIAFVVASVLILLGAAALIDPARVASEPPVLLLPLSVLLCVAVPGAAVRATDEHSRGTAIGDALTGALNRIALEARVSELVSASQGGHVPVGIVIADIDHFKSVNDQLGHEAGDQVLCAVVERMRAQLDRFTPLYRVGGEEFIILVPGADVDAVAALAERLRRAVCAQPIGGRAITMSFGVASATLHDHAFDQVLAEADEALYAAKQGGRDRVVRAVDRPDGVLVAVDLHADATASAARAADDDDAAVIAMPAYDRVAAARELLGNANGSWLVRDELERDHLRDLNDRLSTTHNAAFGFVALALVASIPWLGWELFIPALIVIPGYVAIEHQLHRFRRPEYALMAAWIAVQLSLLGGAAIVPIPAPYQLLLFVAMLVGTAAVFPARGVVFAAGANVAIVLGAAIVANRALLIAEPGLVAGPIALIVLIALASAVTGRSALDHRADAVVDPLTGLLNRAALQARVAELTHWSVSDQSRVAVIVCDLDGFKGINDTRGHGVGDEVIRAVGGAMRKHLGGVEWAFRLGGDEFVVLLPHGEAEAAGVAEQLRAVVEELTVQGVVVTGSFGVAASQIDEVFDFDCVFRRADEALYEAKRAGRNRVEVQPGRAAS